MFRTELHLTPLQSRTRHNPEQDTYIEQFTKSKCIYGKGRIICLILSCVSLLLSRLAYRIRKPSTPLVCTPFQYCFSPGTQPLYFKDAVRAFPRFGS